MDSLQQAIRDLEGERQKIEEALRALRAISSPSKKRPSGRPSAEITRRYVEQFIRDANRPLQTPELKEAFRREGIQEPSSGLFSILARAAKMKKSPIKKVGPGTWSVHNLRLSATTSPRDPVVPSPRRGASRASD